MIRMPRKITDSTSRCPHGIGLIVTHQSAFLGDAADELTPAARGPDEEQNRQPLWGTATMKLERQTKPGPFHIAEALFDLHALAVICTTLWASLRPAGSPSSRNRSDARVTGE